MPRARWQRCRRYDMRSEGYRLTRPRQVILQVLEKASEYLSAEDVYLKVHAVYPHIGLTTVYRTLEFLTARGVVAKFHFGHGRAKFSLSEAYKGIGHYHQLVCTQCSRVINYTEFMGDELKFIKKAEEGLSKKYKFKINDHVIQFTGLCENCRKDRKGKKE